MQQTEEFYTENKQDGIRRKKENWKPVMSVMWTCTIQWKERIICHKDPRQSIWDGLYQNDR